MCIKGQVLEIELIGTYRFEQHIPTTCPLPNGGKCVVQHSNSTADVVFRTARGASPSYPERYWPGQIVAVHNMA